MGMTPEEYFEGFVMGNFSDFEENPDSIRHAFNAVIACSHFADHYFEYYRLHNSYQIRSARDIHQFVKQLSDETNGAFGRVRDIANAFKHLYRGAKYPSIISSAGAVERLRLSGEYSVRELNTEWEDQNGKIVYTEDTGTQHDLMADLRIVFKHEERLIEEARGSSKRDNT